MTMKSTSGLSSLVLLVATFATTSSSEAFVLPRSSSPNALLLSTRTAATPTSTSLNMGILNRFRKKEPIKIDPIRPGQQLPEIDVDVVVGTVVAKDYEDNAATTAATIHEVVGGTGTNLLIGMPGAYTPTCSESHMPGYLKSVDKLKMLGVDTIAVVTTNGT